ncbi:MAG: GTP-binding protein [Promethearchaeota archaeon]
MLEDGFSIKIVILGNGGIGKTALANKFLIKKFPERYLPTLRHTIFRKKFELPSERVLIKVWDVGGQKSYNVFNPAIYKKVDIALLVFDLTKPEETLRNIKKEKEKLMEYNKKFVSITIGNKLDSISFNEDLKEIIKNNLLDKDRLSLVSAKTGENVEKCFELLIYDFLKKSDMDKIAEEFVALIEKTEKELMNCLIDVEKIDLFQRKTKKSATPAILYTIDDLIEKYNQLWNELEKVDTQRTKTYKAFLSKMSEMEELGNYFKKSQIMSVDILKEQLLINKQKCETELNYLKALKKAENNFLDLIMYKKIKNESNLEAKNFGNYEI